MKKITYVLIALAAVFSLSGCAQFLERTSKTTLTDDNYWSSDDNMRLFVDGGYSYYFTGYNSGWSATHATGTYGDHAFSPDWTPSGALGDILTAVPADNWYRTEGINWLARRGGAPWNFGWVRKWNTMIERLETYKANFSDEEYNHWMGVARFLRGWEYSKLVCSFGDIPYYDKTVGSADKDMQFKARDIRTEVMKACMADFDYAIANVRANDGVNYINKYVVGTIASRCMLFEGTWYIYHKTDPALQTCGGATVTDALAKTFLEKAVSYAEVVINSGKYAIDTEFNELFGTIGKDTFGSEILLYRPYSDALAVRHAIASYCNLREGQSCAPGNLWTIKGWICNDGKYYTESSATNASSLKMIDCASSRDPRFEATFNPYSCHLQATGIYCTKFIAREGPTLWADATNSNRPEYRSNTNTNGFPCVRYAETLLNWIEAKAELADKFGGAAVTQADLDKSINALRDRPLPTTFVNPNVTLTKTAHLVLGTYPNDPTRTDEAQQACRYYAVTGNFVPALIWEIRRERRMELYMEHPHLTVDTRRWGQLELMNDAVNPDIKVGAWVDLVEAKTQEQRPWALTAADSGLLKFMKEDGTFITYTLEAGGTVWENDNSAECKGYLVPKNQQGRTSINFQVRNYLEPICTDVLAQYKENGYEGVLVQNAGWE